MEKTISIIVNYDNYHDTIETIENLEKQILKFEKIIVVDNCSRNNSYDILKEKFKNIERVIIIKSDRNGGFSYGNNFGMKYALENFEFDFFLMINNDTISNNDINKKFVEYYKNSSNSNLGILTGKIYYYDDSSIIWYAGGKIDKLKCNGVHFGENEVESPEKYNIEKEVNFSTACLWFFHKSLLDKIGFLDEDYFMYVEDLDYCMRVIKAKYKIIYLPNIVIWHKIGRSSNNNSKTPNYYYGNRNRILCAKKNLSFIELIKFLLFLIFTRFFVFFKWLTKFKIINTFEGIMSGFNNKTGKRGV